MYKIGLLVYQLIKLRNAWQSAKKYTNKLSVDGFRKY